MFMTALSVLILVFLAKAQIFNRFRTGMTLTVIFASYLCLICYEFVMLVGFH